jgi:hypothetical protein
VECDLAGREGQWVQFRARLPWKLMRETIRAGRLAQEAGSAGDSKEEDSAAESAAKQMVVLTSLDEHFGIIERVLRRAVIAWGLVGEDGAVLPLPSENEQYLEELTQDEVYWLYNGATSLSKDEAKN